MRDNLKLFLINSNMGEVPLYFTAVSLRMGTVDRIWARYVVPEFLAYAPC